MNDFHSPRWSQRLQLLCIIITTMITTMASCQIPAQGQRKESRMNQPTFYRTLQVDGLSIFYRESGQKDAPTILCLHGLPSSSRMFEPLFIRLSDRYHLVAPDYPGFGHSDWPDPKKFAYTFDHIAETMNHFTEALGLSHYSLYLQDYGGPVGFRMASVHPDRIEALIVQDAVARPTKAHCAQIFFRSRPRGRAMSGMISMWSAMTRISGPMNLLF